MGGMEQQLMELVNGCLADERDVTVISRACEVPPHPRLRVHHVPGPTRPLPLAFPWFEVAASRALRRHGRGLVHACGAIVPDAVDVVTVHFCHRAYNRLGRSRASRDSPAHRLNSQIAAVVSEAGERWSYRPSRVRAIVAVSDGVEREVAAQFPAVRDRISTIPHGVDARRFRPDPAARAALRSERGFADDTPVAVFVGGDWRRKGLDHALQAVAAAPGWRLVVVGAGDREEAGRRALALSVADRVVFAGRSEHPEREFAAADVFVLPTSYETFSLVSYEAAASGLPLLVTPVSGPDALIEEGRNGHFLTEDPARTAALLDGLRDPATRRRLGEEAQRSALPYTWEAAIAAHLRLYDGLVPAGA